MDINITDRIIILVGPTSSGKSTLAKRIKESTKQKTVIVSHDEILSTINRCQSQEKIDFEFRNKFLEELNAVIGDLSNKFIVLDTMNIDGQALFAFLMLIINLENFSEYRDLITLLKVNVPMEKHLKYFEKRKSIMGSILKKEVLMQQKNIFMGIEGSLFVHFSFCEEYVITDPEETQFIFN